MSNRKNVVNNLKACLSGSCQGCMLDGLETGCIRQLMTDSLELLDEQEQIEPKVIIDTYVCGNCGEKVESQTKLGDNVIMHDFYNYCHRCGKKVKWNV